jgi:hypothetical protein
MSFTCGRPGKADFHPTILLSTLERLGLAPAPSLGVAHSIVIAVIIRALRRALESAARINILRRSVLRRSREKYIIASPAQPRSVASKAGGDAICVRYVGPAEPKHIRCAGLTLLLGPLSARRCFSGEKKCKCCDRAGYLMRPRYRSLSVMVRMFNQQMFNSGPSSEPNVLARGPSIT